MTPISLTCSKQCSEIFGLCYVRHYLLKIAACSFSTVRTGEVVTHHTRQHLVHSSAGQFFWPWVVSVFCSLRSGNGARVAFSVGGRLFSSGQRWVQRFTSPPLDRVVTWALFAFLSAQTKVTILLCPLASVRHFHAESSLSLNIFCFLQNPNVVVDKNVCKSDGAEILTDYIFPNFTFGSSKDTMKTLILWLLVVHICFFFLIWSCFKMTWSKRLTEKTVCFFVFFPNDRKPM